MTPARIGTSGWHYADWIGPFYPAGTAKKALLTAYSKRFSTTEINASFYRVPTERAVAAWRDNAPDGFLFAWKASRFITHFKQLNDVGQSIAYVIGRMAPLDDKFGPVLWQLPPRMKPNHDKLGSFIEALPRERLHAVEFRNEGWYCEATFRLLRDMNVSLCLSDHADAPAPCELTADHVYIRPHGPGGRYEGRYGNEVLERWAGRIAKWQRQGRAVFCYFDNDVKSAAPFDAETLVGLVRKQGAPVA